MKIALTINDVWAVDYRKLRVVLGRKLSSRLQMAVEQELNSCLLDFATEISETFTKQSPEVDNQPTIVNSRPAPNAEIPVVEPNGAEQKPAKMFDDALDQLQ